VWTRFTKLIQWGTITGFVIYGVLFMEVDERLISPFQPVCIRPPLLDGGNIS
jgi:hypothetical protein